MSEQLVPLVLEEVQDFERLEAVIRRGLDTFIDVGNALMEIRERKLYRHYGTFEAYLQSAWPELSRRQAYRMMDAALAVENVSHGTQTLPANERQARELAKLNDQPEVQAQAWQEAVATAPAGKITAAHVTQVVAAYAAPPPEPDDVDDEGAELLPDDLYDALNLHGWQLEQSKVVNGTTLYVLATPTGHIQTLRLDGVQAIMAKLHPPDKEVIARLNSHGWGYLGAEWRNGDVVFYLRKPNRDVVSKFAEGLSALVDMLDRNAANPLPPRVPAPGRRGAVESTQMPAARPYVDPFRRSQDAIDSEELAKRLAANAAQQLAGELERHNVVVWIQALKAVRGYGFSFSIQSDVTTMAEVYSVMAQAAIFLVVRQEARYKGDLARSALQQYFKELGLVFREDA